VKAWLVACASTYTRDHFYATHVLPTYRFAWKCVLWFAQEHTQAIAFTRLCKFVIIMLVCDIYNKSSEQRYVCEEEMG